MASYAFATLQARQTLQELWEQGKTVKDMAEALDVPLSTLYTELRRGRSGVRLPDQRLQYDAIRRRNVARNGGSSSYFGDFARSKESQWERE